MKKKTKKVFLSGIERFLYKICILVIICLIVGIVCSETSLAQVNVEVQKLKQDVSEQEKVNESLEMKIDEMTSLENIMEICDEYGLSYHSENIKTIN